MSVVGTGCDESGSNRGWAAGRGGQAASSTPSCTEYNIGKQHGVQSSRAEAWAMVKHIAPYSPNLFNLLHPPRDIAAHSAPAPDSQHSPTAVRLSSAACGSCQHALGPAELRVAEPAHMDDFELCCDNYLALGPELLSLSPEDWRAKLGSHVSARGGGALPNGRGPHRAGCVWAGGTACLTLWLDCIGWPPAGRDPAPAAVLS